MRKFLRSCNLHFNGPLKDLEEAVKINYLLIWAGSDGQDIADTFTFAAAEQRTLQSYITRFENYVKPRSNFRVARYRLFGCSQQSDEAADAYMKRIKELISQCDYDIQVSTTLLVDVFIFGLHLKSVQSALLKEGKDLTVEKALQVARTEEATRQQIEVIRGDRDKKTVNYVTKRRQANPLQENQMQKPPNNKKCGNCGRQHEKGACPAKGARCNSCGKMNHWAKVCRSNKTPPKAPPRGTRTKVHETQVQDLLTSDELYFDTIHVDTTSSSIADDATQAFVSLKIGTSAYQDELKCKVDTGAEGNILPLSIYQSLEQHTTPKQLPPLTPSSVKIVAYGGTAVKLHGTCNLGIRHKNEFTSAVFYVTDTKGPVLIGLPTCQALGLVSLNFNVQVANHPPTTEPNPKGSTITRDQVLEQYPDVFDGIGCFEGTFKITVDPAIQPVIHPPGRIPINLRDTLKEELDSLVEQDILSQVTYPTDWVNSCVCVTKRNGKLRLCLDPPDPNKAVKRPHYVTPTLEDILSKLHGAKWFSILDARSGYWNMKLDNQSADLTTFNTPFGRQNCGTASQLSLKRHPPLKPSNKLFETDQI